MDRTLRQMGGQQTMPAGVFEIGGQTLVTQDEADARYQAAQDWFDTYGHLVISNGPFFLARYDPPAQFAELDAFRDPTYPFTASDFDLGPPPTLSIDAVDDATITVGQEASIDGDGPGARARSALRYLLVDPSNGTVVQKGEARRGHDPGRLHA